MVNQLDWVEGFTLRSDVQRWSARKYVLECFGDNEVLVLASVRHVFPEIRCMFRATHLGTRRLSSSLPCMLDILLVLAPCGTTWRRQQDKTFGYIWYKFASQQEVGC